MADNILRVGTEFDVGPLVAGAEQVGAAMVDVGAKMGDASKATLDLLYPTEQLETAQVETVSTNSELAAAIAALTIEINKLAIAKQGAANAAGGMSGATAKARAEVGALTDSSGMLEGGLARVAAQSAVLGPLITAAFPIFAAIAFVEILTQVVDWFDKATDAAAGYTKAVQEMEKAAVKASDENLYHATSLGEAQQKLGEIVKEQGKLAEETYGQKYVNALQKIAPEISKNEGLAASLGDALKHTALDPLSPFAALYDSLVGISKAEGGAADEAARLAAAQIKAQEEVAKFTVELDRQAISLLSAKEDADKAGVAPGAQGRVQSLNVEIAALKEKERIEKEIASAQHPGDQGVAAAAVGEEYYYKQIALTKELSTAQFEAAKDIDNQTERIVAGQKAATDKIADNWQKYVDEVKKDTLEEYEAFNKTNEKEIADSAAKTIKQIEDAQAYREQSLKIDEQTALGSIAAQETAVKDQAALDALKIQGTAFTVSEKEKLINASNIAELNALKELKDQEIAAEVAYLQQLRAIELGGESEADLVAKGKTAQLEKVKAIDAQIETAERQHATAMKQIDQQISTDQQQEINKREAAIQKEIQKTTDAFNSGVLSWIKGQETFGQAMRQVWQQIASDAITAILRIGEQWLITHVIMAAIAKAFGLDDNSAAAAGKKVAAAAVAVNADAAWSAADVFLQAIEHIPFPANLIAAPALAEVAHSEALSVAAFEQGGISEAGGLAQLHPREMVLPAGISVPLQGMMPAIHNFNSTVAAGGANHFGGATSTSTRGDTHNHININSGGSKMTHGDIIKAVRRGVRMGELR